MNRIAQVTCGGRSPPLGSVKIRLVRISTLIVVVALAVPLLADTIVLKNGRQIHADTAHTKNGRVEYEVDGNSYAIPASIVDHIETAAAPRFPTPPASADRVLAPPPELTPTVPLPLPSKLGTEVVHNGEVDRNAISAAEATGKPNYAAAANFFAGQFEQQAGHREQALSYYQRASYFLPENAPLLDHQAAILIQLGRTDAAVDIAERAVSLAANSADTLALAGYAYFAADRNREAIRMWKRSLDIRPDATVQSLLAKAEREQSVEAGFVETESGHFILRFEGSQTPATLGKAILQTLESHYNDLVRQLDVVPPSSIAVILYTNRAYFDVTQSPSWTGAVNDGKIRIPIEGITSVTPELSRVLRHELTHSFVNQITGGRCPQWLNEGVAQVMEPRSLNGFGHQLSLLYQSGHDLPLNQLESSFMGLNSQQATVAYAESLATVQYIARTYGMEDVRQILDLIGHGSSAEAALHTVIHSGYAGLRQEVADYLKQAYPN